MDESLSAIDAASRIRILGLLKELKGHMAILLISHVPEIVLSISDRLIMLKSGKLEDLGPLSTLSYHELDTWSRDLLGIWNEVT